MATVHADRNRRLSGSALLDHILQPVEFARGVVCSFCERTKNASSHSRLALVAKRENEDGRIEFNTNSVHCKRGKRAAG